MDDQTGNVEALFCEGLIKPRRSVVFVFLAQLVLGKMSSFIICYHNSHNNRLLVNCLHSLGKTTAPTVSNDRPTGE